MGLSPLQYMNAHTANSKSGFHRPSSAQISRLHSIVEKSWDDQEQVIWLVDLAAPWAMPISFSLCDHESRDTWLDGVHGVS